MKIEKYFDYGCVTLVALVVAMILTPILWSLKNAGEQEVVENTKKILGYKPEILKIDIEELKPFKDRVFEKPIFNTSEEGVIFRQSLSFEEFQKLDQNKAFALFDYSIEETEVLITFNIYLLVDGVRYSTTLTKTIKTPKEIKVLDVKYVGNGRVEIEQTFDKKVSSIVLLASLIFNNAVWILIVVLILRHLDKIKTTHEATLAFYKNQLAEKESPKPDEGGCGDG